MHESAPVPPRLPDEAIVGGYRADVLLATGGSAAVYRATALATGEAVALKLLLPVPPASARQRVRRFEREAHVLARLDHPHVVRLLDHGTLDDGRCYIVLELLRGQTAGAALAAGPMPPREVAQVGRCVALALAVAHDAGVVHRDVKPHNVMLCESEDGAPPVPKLLDFGVSRVLAPDPTAPLTQDGGVVGTPAYMAPEQLAGRPATPASDLFGLGGLLYTLLAGRPPFEADDLLSLAYRVAEHPHPPLPASVPAPMRALVDRLLAKSPDDRPESARAVATELETLQRSGAFPTGRTRGARARHRMRAAGVVALGAAAWFFVDSNADGGASAQAPRALFDAYAFAPPEPAPTALRRSAVSAPAPPTEAVTELAEPAPTAPDGAAPRPFQRAKQTSDDPAPSTPDAPTAGSRDGGIGAQDPRRRPSARRRSEHRAATPSRGDDIADGAAATADPPEDDRPGLPTMRLGR